MGEPLSTTAVITLIVGAASAGLAINAQEAASSDRRRAERASQRRADLAAQRERIKNVRRGRILRAQAEAAGTAGEGTGGSGLTGTTQGLFQQQATNLAFLDQQQRISNKISNLNISASKSASRAATFGAIAGVSSDIFQLQGGFEDLFKD